jgi:hypothetical protein
MQREGENREGLYTYNRREVLRSSYIKNPGHLRRGLSQALKRTDTCDDTMSRVKP